MSVTVTVTATVTAVTVPVTAADRRRLRRLGVATGAALLTLAVSGCSGLGRTAVGPVSYTTEKDAVVTVNSPPVKGCYRLAPEGAKEIVNRTLIDVVVYPTADCTGRQAAYVATTLTDARAGSNLPWRSYRFVH